jgi:beta-glucanase (GH16 family)
MKKLVLIFFSLYFIISQTKAQVVLKLNNGNMIAYSYGGGDEFNSNKLNETEWTNGLPWSRVIISQDLAFVQRNVSVKDGLVIFKANKEDSTYALAPWEIDSAHLKKTKTTLAENKFTAKYSVGCIVTKQKFHYGLYELRFKVEKGQGVWPAFWFYGGNKNEEIDCFELKDERNNEIHVDTHCPYGCDRGYKNKIGFNTNWGGWMPVSEYLHDGFNIMHLEWRKEDLIWYINGYPLAYFKGTFPNPMNLFLNTSVAKDGGAFKPGPDETTTWPNYFSVDYFRSWYEIEKGKEVVLSVNDNFSISDKYPSKYSTRPVKKRGLMYRKKELDVVDGMISLSLSSSNKLTINISGNLKDVKAIITLKGTTTQKVIELGNTEKEIEKTIDPLDKQIEINIQTDGKTYTQMLSLKR